MKQTYEKNGLVIEAPFVLDSMYLPMNEDVADLVDHISSNMKETKTGVLVMVNTTIFSPKIGEVSLEGGAYSSVDEMKKQPGVSGHIFKDEQSSIDGVPGIIQTVSYPLAINKTR